MDVSILLTGIKLIDDYSSLKTAVNQLLTCKELGVDIEFDDFNKEIGKKMSVIQIYDGTNSYVIDVITILKNKNSINILSKIFNNNDIVKIFHSCESDLSFLSKYNLKIQNILDTNILNKRLLDTSSDISLKNLIKRELDIDLDKTEQKSNWLIRPLTYSQITYAANDVKHLIELKNSLIKKLNETNKETVTQIKISKEDYKYDKLEKFLEKLCAKYSKEQINILRRQELSLLINKRIYEKKYLAIIFRNKFIYNHLDELSTIIKEIVTNKTQENTIENNSENANENANKISEIKFEIFEILESYNNIYQKYNRRSIKNFSYIGVKIEDKDLWKYLEDNNINKKFITDGAVGVFKNKTKKYND